VTPSNSPDGSTAPIWLTPVALKEVHQVFAFFAYFHFLDHEREPNQNPIIAPSIAISSPEKIMSETLIKSSMFVTKLGLL
jgi:hypothetical protein